MKNIYLVQANYSDTGSLFLPYAAGTLAAYSLSHKIIRDHYCFKDFIITKSRVSDVISQMDFPFLVGFSSYLWNIEYNLILAQEIKKKWPECIVVFGGPQIPDDLTYLEKYSFIDILMHGEGEATFFYVLRAFSEGMCMDDIPNISFRKDNGLFKTRKEDSPDIVDFPSPYSTGLFDAVINNPKYKDVQFDAVIETNRGCPYGCIYCCWARSGSSFRKFPLTRVKSDLDWIAQHKISYCMCADSNFGILDRDMEIAQYTIELKKKYGFPQVFETTAAKNKDDLTFEINRCLDLAGLNRGVSVAVQSMTPEVLDIIGRKDIGVSNLKTQLERYNRAGIYTYTDVILGLPGETLESYCRGLFSIIEAGQHYCIAMYRCEFLPNTIMYSKEYIDKYKIKTIVSRFCQNHEPIDDNKQLGSRSEIVVETSTMSCDEWKTALKITACAQSFHCMGMLRFIAIYLRKAKKISYFNFYMSLFDWIETKSIVIKNIFEKVFSSVDPFLSGHGSLNFTDSRFGDIYWPFEEGVFLCCCAEADQFYGEIKVFLRRYFEDSLLFDDLFNYQKEMLALPGTGKKSIETLYDWNDYFNHIFDESITEPERKEMVITVKCSGMLSWKEYAREIVWYGRRNGKMLNTVMDSEI
ncbi:MAG: radical SAM protein [Oscillospiraceae bacterium]|nr:radical SAM protein [Oscillospiraceae bacterium]MDD6145605.1 radical SAM protein [Oscillospiraceae bacterium]